MKATHLELAQQRQTAPDPEVLRDAERACSMSNKALHKLQLMVQVRVVCEHLAFQDCILLLQCLSFPVFVQQSMQHTRPGAFFVDHRVHPLGNAGRGNPNTYLRMYLTMTHHHPVFFSQGSRTKNIHKVGMEAQNTTVILKSMFVWYGATKRKSSLIYKYFQLALHISMT